MLQSKFWQGFFALAPLIFLFLFMIGYFGFILFVIANEGDMSPEDHFGLMGGIMAAVIIVLGMIFISFGSLIYYIIHAAKNPNLQGNNLLVVWILLFIFANGIGQLIYWIVEILGKPKPSGNM